MNWKYSKRIHHSECPADKDNTGNRIGPDNCVDIMGGWGYIGFIRFSIGRRGLF